MSIVFHELSVIKIVTETSDAKSISFDIGGLEDSYSFQSGQYISLDVVLNGEKYRRAYSLSSSPQSNELTITVKKVEQGKVSTFLVDELKENDKLSVGTPEGNFTIDWAPDSRRQHYFFVAGSGITPIMSMIQDGMEQEPLSSFYLLYGNKTKEDIIFKSQFESLAETHSGQLYIHHTLTQVVSNEGKLLKLYNRSIGKHELKGRINEEKGDWLMEQYPFAGREHHVYICGPGAMIDTMKSWATSKVPDKRHVHMEYFTAAPVNSKSADSSLDSSALMTAVFSDGSEELIPVKKDQTLLDAMLAQSLDPPYSCLSGICSSCVAKVVEGEVRMESCLALDDDEQADGYILTCQAHAITSKVKLVYD